MGSPRVKVTVSLPPELLAQLRSRVAAGDARSVSAYVEHAVVGQLAAEADFDALANDVLAATGGAPSPEELAAARRLLTGDAA